MYNKTTENFSKNQFPEKFENNALYFCDLAESRGGPVEYISNVSVKYVEEGAEFYKVGAKPVEIKSGFYFIVNEGQQVFCEPPYINRSLALSAFINQDLVDEVFTHLKSDFTALLDFPFERLKSNSFYEEVFFYKEDNLGKFFHHIVTEIKESGNLKFEGEDIYYLIAELLLKSHYKNVEKTKRINKEKPGTREEIFRRVNKGKVMIEDCLFEPVTIDQIAKEATLSKYHFIRLFSEAFGISPYRYLLKRRIEEARNMLEARNLSVSEVAARTGFADVSSFSKRFKKETGIAPSRI